MDHVGDVPPSGSSHSGGAFSRTPQRWSPDLPACEESTYTLDIPPNGQMKIRMNLDPRDDIVEFALVQRVLRQGTWHQVVRVDTAHDEVHVHRFTRSGGETVEFIRRIEGPHDVAAGYDNAYVMMLEDWDESVRRWDR